MFIFYGWAIFHCVCVCVHVCIYKPIWSNVLFKAIVFLLIFSLDDTAIGKTGLLKSPKIVVLLFICHFQFSSVTQSCPALYDSMDCSTPGLFVHQQLPEFTQTHVHWVSDSIEPSHPLLPFSSHLQSFLASGSFQMSQFFASGGQSIGVSASASVLPMNIQGWFPLGWTGILFCPMSESLSRKRRLPRQCNSQKGKFITDLSQGFLPQPTQWRRVRKSLEQRLLPKFIRYA